MPKAWQNFASLDVDLVWLVSSLGTSKTYEVFPSHHPVKLRKSGFLTCEVSNAKSVAELRQFRCGFSLVA